VDKLAYDSWGKRRDEASPTPPSTLNLTDNKGFTGHEMLDKLDLVHMNGRVYDPLIARFISADPIIQAPEHSQSYNRYSYVWNNPTNLTDPTGFIGQAPEREQEKPPEPPKPNSIIPCRQSSKCEAWVNYVIKNYFGNESSPKSGGDPTSGQSRKDAPASRVTGSELLDGAGAGLAALEAGGHAEMMQLWGNAADYWMQRQVETGNGLYAIPGTLATMLSNPEIVEKLGFAAGFIGSTRGVKPGDVMSYRDFAKRSVVGDKIEGHEVWQFSNMRANGVASKRLGTDASKNNPVVALSKETHQQVTVAQRSIDASNQTPVQNIQANANVLRQTKAVSESVISRIEKWALEHAKKLGF
jgi:RHS repeat-associated protein